jgi:hypothetical protein
MSSHCNLREGEAIHTGNLCCHSKVLEYCQS